MSIDTFRFATRTPQKMHATEYGRSPQRVQHPAAPRQQKKKLQEKKKIARAR